MVNVHFDAARLGSAVMFQPDLLPGDFVRVRADHPDRTRAGKNAIVVEARDDGVSLSFKFEEAKLDVPGIVYPVEQWDVAELDLATVDRTTRLTVGSPSWQRIRRSLH